jgi:hypothetical protein
MGQTLSEPVVEKVSTNFDLTYYEIEPRFLKVSPLLLFCDCQR